MIGSDIQRAASLLKTGQVVAIPTETVYGLAANALDAEAVALIFAIKKRPAFDPLIVHIHSVEQLRAFTSGQVTTDAIRLVQTFWPGPLTVVLPKAEVIPDIVTAGLPTVGIRMPAHPVVRQLLSILDFPLAAPSANPFGYISPVNAAHVADQLGEQIPYILDGGVCQVGLESTIVDCTTSPCKVLRLGGISIREIADALGYIPESLTHSISNPRAPGMLTTHYAPRKKLILTSDESVFAHYAGQPEIAFLRSCTPFTGHKIQYLLSSDPYDDRKAASRLFSLLRELDSNPLIKLIIAERVPDHGLGSAINDRLTRAASEIR